MARRIFVPSFWYNSHSQYSFILCGLSLCWWNTWYSGVLLRGCLKRITDVCIDEKQVRIPHHKKYVNWPTLWSLSFWASHRFTIMRDQDPSMRCELMGLGLWCVCRHWKILNWSSNWFWSALSLMLQGYSALVCPLHFFWSFKTKLIK